MKKLLYILACLTSVAKSSENPTPRAISGDDRQEPPWTQRLLVKVGISDGDLRGDSDKAIQAAVDYVARLGGGTVDVLPGIYRFRNSVFLASNVKLIGHGAETVFFKEASTATQLAQDSDWYDQEILLKDSAGFRVGDGVCLRSSSARFAIKRTLIASDGPRFKLDRPLRENVWQDAKGASVETLFPLISGENVEDAVIENLTLDGNRQHNGLLDGNYAGCVWLQDCRSITLRGIEARSYHGDGLSWQVCHDVTVENCHSHGHSGLGLHPGSGSQRTIIRGCRLEDNDIGIFFCWGVRGGLAQDNIIRGNRVGISIGHRDTDNVVRGNTISASRETGLLFRQEKDAAAAGHRNLLEGNLFTDNGPETGAAITLQAPVQGVTLKANKLKETRGAANRAGIEVGAGVGDLRMEGNAVEGFSTEVRKP